MRRLVNRFARLAVVGIASALKRLLPTRALLLVKERLDAVGVMDYREPIYLNLETSLEYTERLGSVAKEPETIAWIEEFVKPNDVLADIGANVGAYALVAAKATQNQATVYAFEPAFANYAELCRNIRLNGCGESVIPLPVALSDRTGVDVFRYSSLAPGAARHASGAESPLQAATAKPVFEHRMLTYRLDDLIESMGLRTPNHIKIDVDGNESLVLRGAERALSDEGLRSLLVEVDERSPAAEEIVRLLADKGFKLRSKHKYVYGGETGPYSTMFNYVFTRSA